MVKKIRVNISVDKEMLRKAKLKLSLFGGKLSTLFDAYLKDFVNSFSMHPTEKNINEKLKELESRIKKIEDSRA